MASKSTLSDLISKCKNFFSSDVAKEWKDLYEKWSNLVKKWKETLAAAKKKNKSDSDKKKILANSKELFFFLLNIEQSGQHRQMNEVP